MGVRFDIYLWFSGYVYPLQSNVKTENETGTDDDAINILNSNLKNINGSNLSDAKKDSLHLGNSSILLHSRGCVSLNSDERAGETFQGTSFGRRAGEMFLTFGALTIRRIISMKNGNRVLEDIVGAHCVDSLCSKDLLRIITITRVSIGVSRHIKLVDEELPISVLVFTPTLVLGDKLLKVVTKIASFREFGIGFGGRLFGDSILAKSNSFSINDVLSYDESFLCAYNGTEMGKKTIYCLARSFSDQTYNFSYGGCVFGLRFRCGVISTTPYTPDSDSNSFDNFGIGSLPINILSMTDLYFF